MVGLELEEASPEVHTPVFHRVDSTECFFFRDGVPGLGIRERAGPVGYWPLLAAGLDLREDSAGASVTRIRGDDRRQVRVERAHDWAG